MKISKFSKIIKKIVIKIINVLIIWIQIINYYKYQKR